MLYVLLVYHPESVVESWSKAEDDALMDELHRVHRRLLGEGKLGPAARLGPTSSAVTVREPGSVTDGPFAETKEQLLGFYMLDCASREEAVAIASDLRRVNPTAAYEVREVIFNLAGNPLSGTVI